MHIFAVRMHLHLDFFKSFWKKYRPPPKNPIF
nr:MAG TPA: hypothetical protein [Caudoviricetes sp.]